MRSCCHCSRPVSWRSAASAFRISALPDDVAADFFGGAGGDVLVAGDDRLARAALERDRSRRRRRRCSGSDGRQRQDQRESGGDAADSERAIGQLRLSIGSSADRPPEAQRAQDVASGLGRHLEPRADGAGPLAPGEENRRRVVDDGPLKRRHAGSVLVIVWRRANPSSAASTAVLLKCAVVERPFGVPEQVRPHQRRAARRRRSRTLEVPGRRARR